MKVINKIRSRVDSRLKSLTPKRLIARASGSRVIANSVPKSGTHLLTQGLSLFPALSYSGAHYTRGPATPEQLEPFLKKNGNGRFSAAHLWWSAECSSLLDEYSFKTILMVRDPRDVVVSGVFYILQRPDHHMHSYYSSLPDLEKQITAYINGVSATYSGKGIEMANIAAMFNNYLPWEREDNTLLLRFEDLVGPHGGGELDTQLAKINDIANHIGVSLTHKEISHIAENIYASKSVTFRKGGSGEWRQHFSKQHIALFKSLTGSLLTTLGYETDNQWQGSI